MHQDDGWLPIKSILILRRSSHISSSKVSSGWIEYVFVELLIVLSLGLWTHLTDQGSTSFGIPYGCCVVLHSLPDPSSYCTDWGMCRDI